MPNKITFRDLLEDVTEEANVIGAVNTSFVRLDASNRRRHIGTNTDCIGIRESILQRTPDAITTAKGRPAVLIGGGGAARSAAFALWKWFQPSGIYVVNRFKSEVDTLIDWFKTSAPDMKLQHLTTVTEAEEIETPGLVIGTVPDSPPTAPEEILCWEIRHSILRKKGQGIVLDMCYLPSPLTSLYTDADANGWKVIPGTDVLVRVCIAQQTLWLEKDVSEHAVRRALSAIWEAASRDQKPSAASKL